MALKKSEWHRNSEKSFLKFAYAIFYSIRNIFERTMAKGKKQRKQDQDSDSEWVKIALFSKFQNPRTRTWKFSRRSSCWTFHTWTSYQDFSHNAIFSCESYNQTVQKLLVQKKIGRKKSGIHFSRFASQINGELF